MTKNTESFRTCPVCECATFAVVATLPNVPLVANLQYETKGEAVSARLGDIRLVICRQCSHIFNDAFDENNIDYAAGYENALEHSSHFREFLDTLAERLVTDHSLQKKRLVEIGCGNGYFLKRITRLGGNEGVGFDPSMKGRTPEVDNSSVAFIGDNFSIAALPSMPDFVCCRHVLEHVTEPLALLEEIYGVLKRSNGSTYFEVPNGDHLITHGNLWDLIYEHYSYFTSASLHRAFVAAGFSGVALRSSYSGQFLSVDAAANVEDFAFSTQELTSNLLNLATNLAAAFKKKITQWNDWLQAALDKDETVCLWGAGSKGVTFLNVVPNAKHISFVVDVNPSKQNKYLAGTGHQVVSPAMLSAGRPAHVIVANPVYKEEIQAQLRALSIHSQVRCL